MGLFSKLRNQPQASGVIIDDTWPEGTSNGFVVFDLETTGLSPKMHRILEIGLIKVDGEGKTLGYWSTLINPQQEIGATDIHGISQLEVKDAPTFEEAVDSIIDRIKGQVLVAHNASFDVSFLAAEMIRTGWHLPEAPIVCTMLESKYFLPGIARKRLDDCAGAIGLNQQVQHRALGDASVAAALFNFYLNGPVDTKRSAYLRGLPVQAANVIWPSNRGDVVRSTNSILRPTRQSRPVQLDLLKSMNEIMPEDLLGDTASPAEISYADLLLSSTEDGTISDAEIEALGDCASSFGLSNEIVQKIHKALLMALAREAWRDGAVSRAEKLEISECARRLGLPESFGKECLKEIEDLRAARISAHARNLPTDWPHGDPLRVGDRVVITGCYDVGRDELESTARKVGLKVTGAVSGKTTVLVSDGTINGNKDADAQRLGIRVIEPETFRELLNFVQPAVPNGSERQDNQSDLKSHGDSSETAVSKTEKLVCVSCGNVFLRVVSRGRKPHECDACRTK